MGNCFFSIVASIMVLMNHNIKGTRQGDIKHASKIRPIALLFITNVACIVPLTLGLPVSLTGNLTNLGHILADVTSNLLVGV
jgi:hypothetical protein